MADGQGNLWIATSDGISRRDARTQEWKQLYGGRQQSFLSLASDGKGRGYAGTYGDGLYVLDEASGRELHPLYPSGRHYLRACRLCVCHLYRQRWRCVDRRR